MIKRIFKQQLIDMLQVFPVVALVGSRQVGKSTLVQESEVARGRVYFTLDDFSVRGMAEEDPGALLDGSKPMTVDEIQLVPSLLREIKLRVDQNRIPGRYLVTGSADLNHLADLSHVLAGRVGILQLPPITHWEECGRQGIPDWFRLLEGETLEAVDTRAETFSWDRLVRGGFPLNVTATNDESRRQWTESFRQTYLERDLRRIRDISRITEFSRLMSISATRTGQILNQAQLGREVGLTNATTGRYLSLLEASFLIRRLQPWSVNIGKRLVKAPKLYWTDTGLASALCGIRKEDLPEHPMTGALFETHVIMEIESLLRRYTPSARLYWLRTHDGLEIDGMIEHENRRLLFEIKASTTIKPDAVRPIQMYRKLSGSQVPAVIFYAGNQLKPLGKGITAVPITL